jgi:transposase
MGGDIMARTAKGWEVLEKAKKMMAKARTANELRICQAVIFPLEYGMSTEQTAACLGRSISWTTRNRQSFIAASGFAERTRPGGRKRANMTVNEENTFLEPFFDKAKKGGILVVREIHIALEKHLGRKVAPSSTYNLLHRHGWRKLAPDKRHVETDVEVQEEFKKNSRKS